MFRAWHFRPVTVLFRSDVGESVVDSGADMTEALADPGVVNPAMPPQSPERGAIMSFPPPPKKKVPESFYFLSPKNSGLNPWIFQLWR